MSADTNLPDNFSLINEIKHPLTNISLAADMLEVVTDDTEKERYIDIIKKNTVRINSIISKLLEGKQE